MGKCLQIKDSFPIEKINKRRINHLTLIFLASSPKRATEIIVHYVMEKQLRRLKPVAAGITSALGTCIYLANGIKIPDQWFKGL